MSIYWSSEREGREFDRVWSTHRVSGGFIGAIQAWSDPLWLAQLFSFCLHPEQTPNQYLCCEPCLVTLSDTPHTTHSTHTVHTQYTHSTHSHSTTHRPQTFIFYLRLPNSTGMLTSVWLLGSLADVCPVAIDLYIELLYIPTVCIYVRTYDIVCVLCNQ